MPDDALTLVGGSSPLLGGVRNLSRGGSGNPVGLGISRISCASGLLRLGEPDSRERIAS